MAASTGPALTILPMFIPVPAAGKVAGSGEITGRAGRIAVWRLAVHSVADSGKSIVLQWRRLTL